METYFKDALEHPQWYPEMTTYKTVDKGHGRIEKRTYYLSSDLSGLENAADWSGLSGFGMVHSHATVGENESSEIRYAITSLRNVEHRADPAKTGRKAINQVRRDQRDRRPRRKHHIRRQMVYRSVLRE